MCGYFWTSFECAETGAFIEHWRDLGYRALLEQPVSCGITPFALMNPGLKALRPTLSWALKLGPGTLYYYWWSCFSSRTEADHSTSCTTYFSRVYDTCRKTLLDKDLERRSL